jgi:hypothetical protein
MTFYTDGRFGVRQNVVFGQQGAIGSANAARTVVGRHTFMTAVTVQDWNLRVRTGATCTGTAAVPTTEKYVLCLGRMAAGTGTLTLISGSAVIGTAGAADGSVIDDSLTATNFDAGDDICLFAEIGTALGDNSLIAEASVDYVERYT